MVFYKDFSHRNPKIFHKPKESWYRSFQDKNEQPFLFLLDGIIFWSYIKRGLWW